MQERQIKFAYQIKHVCESNENNHFSQYSRLSYIYVYFIFHFFSLRQYYLVQVHWVDSIQPSSQPGHLFPAPRNLEGDNVVRLYFSFPKVIKVILFVVVGGCCALLLFSGGSVCCVLLSVSVLICFSEVQFATSSCKHRDR